MWYNREKIERRDMMTYTYTPKGVCSRQMTVEVEDGIVKRAEVVGGCNGNLQAVTRLITGMTVEDAVQKMRGIRCGMKNTSCPDQLSVALENAAKK
jgi:uncharacterized protein (TIGR03905 family)